MTVLRACVTCGRPSEESYCAEHKPKPWQNSRRRERMGISGGAWATLRTKVLKRDMGVCGLCDKSGAIEVDHIVSVAEGGGNELTNLMSVHPECHAERHRNRTSTPSASPRFSVFSEGWGTTPLPPHPLGPPGGLVARAKRRSRDA